MNKAVLYMLSRDLQTLRALSNRNNAYELYFDDFTSVRVNYIDNNGNVHVMKRLNLDNELGNTIVLQLIKNSFERLHKLITTCTRSYSLLYVKREIVNLQAVYIMAIEKCNSLCDIIKLNFKKLQERNEKYYPEMYELVVSTFFSSYILARAAYEYNKEDGYNDYLMNPAKRLGGYTDNLNDFLYCAQLFVALENCDESRLEEIYYSKSWKDADKIFLKFSDMFIPSLIAGGVRAIEKGNTRYIKSLIGHDVPNTGVRLFTSKLTDMEINYHADLLLAYALQTERFNLCDALLQADNIYLSDASKFFNNIDVLNLDRKNNMRSEDLLRVYLYSHLEKINGEIQYYVDALEKGYRFADINAHTCGLKDEDDVLIYYYTMQTLRTIIPFP